MKHQILTSLFLALAALATVISCIGLLRMRGAAARLHFASWMTLTVPPCVLAAALCEEGLSQTGRKAIFIVAILILQGPLISHILGRAIHSNEHLRVTRK